MKCRKDTRGEKVVNISWLNHLWLGPFSVDCYCFSGQSQLAVEGLPVSFNKALWGFPLQFPDRVGDPAPPPSSCLLPPSTTTTKFLLLTVHPQLLASGISLPGWWTSCPSPDTLLSAQKWEIRLLPNILFSSSCYPSIHFSLAHRGEKAKQQAQPETCRKVEWHIGSHSCRHLHASLGGPFIWL